ncbi:MAG: type II secretion system protein GspG [Dehalococcoidia bacterium]
MLANMGAMQEAVNALGRCPRTQAGIPALVEGGQLEKVPLDAWGNAYEYRTDDQRFTLTSFGADGVEGGDGDAADIRRSFPCPSN